MKKYINVHLSVNEEDYDAVYGILSSLPFSGIEEKYDELVVTFEKSLWTDDLKYGLNANLAELVTHIRITKEEIIEDRNWNEEWEKNVQLVAISDRILISPSWKANEFDSEIRIIINPKMSFGTGEHESTKLICLLMDESIKPNQYWIDAGCGTGVLAILAAKLGASLVLAFDNNEWSINNASENILLNSASEIVKLEEASLETVQLPDADGIAANLNTKIILSNMKKLYNALKQKKGSLLVSGILNYDKDDVIRLAEADGFRLVRTLTENEWIAFHFEV